jgi:SWIM zinc finger
MADIETLWSHFFKPEVRKQGREIFSEGAVSLSIAGDAQIQAFVRVSSGARVSFLAQTIEAPDFEATCNCSAFAKGQLCKHVWATLLKVEESVPDFLSSKTSIEKGEGVARKTGERKPDPAADGKREELLKRQSENRKAQYQRAKEFAKARKEASSPKAAAKASKNLSKFPSAPEFPEDVEAALAYFSQNGFELAPDIELEGLRNAKRVLSRVFHPDKGGSHDEILALNENFDILYDFKQNQ